MVEKLCKNCKHWKRHLTDDADDIYDSKEYHINNGKYGICNNKSFVYIGDKPMISDDEDDELVIERYKKVDGSSLNFWDYEQYGAGLETGENFGCIHFKEGETK